MNLLALVYLAALFVALTPGVLLTLPKGGNKLTVAVVHGLVFAVVWHFTKKMVSGFQNMDDDEYEEGFQHMAATPKKGMN